MLYKVTDEISLTGLLPTDALAITAYIGDRDVSKTLSKVPYPYSMEDAKGWLDDNFEFQRRNGFVKNMAIRNSDGTLIGVIGAHFNYGLQSDKTEFGYWLGKPFWNRGIMTEVIKTYCNVVRTQHKFTSLEAGVFNHNVASQRVLEKAGFAKSGRETDIIKPDGSHEHCIEFIIAL